jgi:hypothetical protein
MAFQIANLVARRGVGISPPLPSPQAPRHGLSCLVYRCPQSPSCAGARRLIPLSSPRVRLYFRAQFVAINMSLDLQATLRDPER